jgi:polysaccharide deacetylase family protein (PEP-CTERM system associated)
MAVAYAVAVGFFPAGCSGIHELLQSRSLASAPGLFPRSGALCPGDSGALWRPGLVNAMPPGVPSVPGAPGARPAAPPWTPARHLLTVVLEDYFQVAPLRGVIPTRRWSRFETRVERNTDKALALLDEFGIKATFFVVGWIADEMPEVVRRVADRGHEIASKGYFHRGIRRLSRAEFRDDLVRSREALERAAGTPVCGYRIAEGWLGPRDLWALDVLAQEGFVYDSSIRPIFRGFAAQPERRRLHCHRHQGRTLWEFPIPSWTVAGWSLPIAGGNYLRQAPPTLMRRAVARWQRAAAEPLLMYFHVWELDPEQPRIQAAPVWERVRQYRNLDRMDGILRPYLETYRFTGIGDYLLRRGVELPRRLPAELPAAAGASLAARRATRCPAPEPEPLPSRLPVTVVVPCYNEELTLPYLANTLRSVEAALAARYELRFVFVDDGSGDGTWEALQRIFGGRPRHALVRHDANRGVAAAILTGIRHAGSEVVCSIDCDCTYDPHQLRQLIPLLREGVDLVTASPYHPLGRVYNVPAWRLGLSKVLSRLYRLVLHQQLATYTSCFRVYRRAAVAGLPVRAAGFLGVAEMLGLLDLAGGRIVECPAALEVRLLGRSKMKIGRTMAGHLRLLARLAATRYRRRDPLAAAPITSILGRRQG